MNFKIFYTAVTAATALLCLAGCGDEKKEEGKIDEWGKVVVMNETQAKPKSNGLSPGNRVQVVSPNGDDPAQTAVNGQYTPYSHIVRMTNVYGRYGDGTPASEYVIGGDNPGGYPDDPYSPPNANYDGSQGTWYRFPQNHETRTTAITMYEHVPTSTGLKDTVKEPDPLGKTTARTNVTGGNIQNTAPARPATTSTKVTTNAPNTAVTIQITSAPPATQPPAETQAPQQTTAAENAAENAETTTRPFVSIN